MSSSVYPEITQQEAQTRHWWLISTFVLNIGPTLLAVLISLFSGILNAIWSELLPSIIGSLISTAIIYHCAYRKFGNVWLTWCLILSTFGVLCELFKMHNSEWDYLLSIIMGATLAAYIWWFKLSLKLRKINQRIKFERSEGAWTIKERLSNASNIDELIIASRKLTDEWPDHGSMIYKLYQERKNSLSLAMSTE